MTAGRQPRTSAWANKQEYHLVYSWLFEDLSDAIAQQKAIERIQGWSTRCKIPFGVEITGLLVRCILHDDLEADGDSLTDTRLMNAMALIRFVNGLVDPLQKSYYASSISNLAGQLGLPGFFVDLRHAATHEDLPTLAALRNGCRLAVDWLHDNYWLPSINVSKNEAQEVTRAIASRVQKYKALRKQSLKAQSGAPLTKEVLSPIRELIKILDADENATAWMIDVLMSVGSLVPASKKKRPKDGFSLSLDLRELWLPLLDKLEEAQEGFLDMLIATMLEIPVDDLSSAGQEISGYGKTYAITILAWINFAISESTKKSSLSRTFDDLDVDAIQERSLLNPNALNRQVLQHLLDLGLSNAKHLGLLIRHIDTVMLNEKQLPRDVVMQEESPDESLDRLKQFEESLNKDKQPVARASRKANLASFPGFWRDIDEFNWTAKPIGCLINGNFPSLDITDSKHIAM